MHIRPAPFCEQKSFLSVGNRFISITNRFVPVTNQFVPVGKKFVPVGKKFISDKRRSKRVKTSTLPRE